MFISILMIMISLPILLFSYGEIKVWGGLYFERDYRCVERLRKTTKATDLVSLVHNVAKGTFGLALLVAGLRRWIPVEHLGIVYSTLVISIVLLVVDAAVMEGVTRVDGLKEVRDSLEKQWKEQKRLSPDHNHEVNLYRGTVRVTREYPKHILAMSTGMLLMQLFLL